MLNELFSQSTASEAGNSSSRSLSGTAQLTQLATDLTNQMLKAVEDNVDKYLDKMQASKTDSAILDSLLDELVDVTTCNVDFLNELSDAVLESMLKSQQSKRSRCKSKVMTLDNYKAMVVGALAERLIRTVTGKTKVAGARRPMQDVAVTDEQLTKYADDPNELNKAIRNVQSKKSIMKAKSGFAETDERWLQLLEVEAQLKSLRGTTGSTTIVVDETKDKLVGMFDGVDVEHMKNAEVRKMIEQVLQLVRAEDAEPPVEETTAM